MLKDGAYLIALPNRDPGDLARSALVTASSQRIRNGEPMAARNVINGHARAAGGNTNAWAPDPRQPGPAWVALEWDGRQSFNVVHVTFLTKEAAARRFAVQVHDVSGWKTIAEVKDNRHRRHVLGLDRTTASKLRVVLLEAEAEDAGICEIRLYDEPDRVVEIARRVAQTMLLSDPEPDVPWDDSILWVTGIDPRKLDGIVIDDTQAEAVGSWVHSEFAGPFIGRGYSHDGNVGKGAKLLRFEPVVPEAGEYELRIAYSAYGNRAMNAPVTVHTARTTKTVRVNQRLKPPIDGLFVSLGTFHLEAGSGTSIEISTAGTDGYVVADAVQLIRMAAVERSGPPGG